MGFIRLNDIIQFYYKGSISIKNKLNIKIKDDITLFYGSAFSTME